MTTKLEIERILTLAVSTNSLTQAEADTLQRIFDLRKEASRRRLETLMREQTIPEVRRFISAARPKPRPNLRPIDTQAIAQQKGIPTETLTALGGYFSNRQRALAQLIGTKTRAEIQALLQDLQAGRRNPLTIARNVAKKNPRRRK